MATKTMELNVSLPIDICYKALYEIGNSLRDWKTNKADKQHYTLEWKTGNVLTSAVVTIVAVLEPIDSTTTFVKCSASHVGLADVKGYLPKALQTLLPLFQDIVDDYLRASHAIQKGIDEGIICPTCNKLLNPGTKFCPNDGTPITVECSKCKHANTPNACFCVGCGAKLM